MAEVRPIPFSAGQASGFDELAGASPAFLNAIPEGEGFRARAGMTAWSDFPTDSPSIGTGAVLALATFQDSVVWVTENDRKPWALVDGAVRDLSITSANGLVDGDDRPRIVTSGALCVIVGGGAPQKITPAWVSDRLAGSPPEFTDIAIMSRRLVGTIADSGEFYWSGFLEAGAEDWDTAIEYREAEARADHNVGLRDVARELWVFGEETTELYVPDADEVYAPTIALDEGCAARFSVIRDGDSACWLDTQIQFRRSTGRSMGQESVISSPIARTLESLTTVSDCYGWRERIGQHTLLCWSFPTEGRTFCYDTKTQSWHERRGWSRGRWMPYGVTSYLWWPERRLHLVGLADGSIAKIDPDAHTDLGDPIKWVARTGFSDAGDGRPKDPEAAYFTFRRGEAEDDSATVEIRWRNDLGPFTEPLSYPLGTAGDVAPTLQVEPAGEAYLQRQYEVSGTADAASVCAGAKERLTLLEA